MNYSAIVTMEPNQKKQFIINNIFVLIYYIILIILATLNIKILSGLIIWNDDICASLANGIDIKNYWTYFVSTPDHGFYFSYFLNVLIAKIIPDLFNINIQDFSISYGSVIRSILLTLIPLCLSNFLFIKLKKNNILFPLSLIICYLLTWYTIFNWNYSVTGLTCFFRLFFPIVPFSLFLLLWQKKIVYNNKLNTSDLIILSLVSFLLPITSEITLAMGTMLVFIFTFIDVLRNKKKYNKINNHKLYYPLFSNIIGLVILLNTKMFWANFFIKENVESLKEIKLITFSEIYSCLGYLIKDVLLPNYVFIALAIISILFLSFFKTPYNLKKRANTFSISITIALFTHFILLFKETPPEYPTKYFISHPDFKPLFMLVFILISFIPISIILKRIQLKRKSFITSIILTILTIYAFNQIGFKSKIAEIENLIQIKKISFYLRDKAFFTQYSKQNRPKPILISFLGEPQHVTTYYFKRIYNIDIAQSEIKDTSEQEKTKFQKEIDTERGKNHNLKIEFEKLKH